MPKPIRLIVEVEEYYVGSVTRQLHNMKGVASFNFDLGTPRHQLNGGGNPATKFDKKADDFVAELLMKSPMTTKVLGQHFVDVGRRPGSTGSALNLMKTAGDIKKLDDGKTWTLTKKAKDRMYHRKKPK